MVLCLPAQALVNTGTLGFLSSYCGLSSSNSFAFLISEKQSAAQQSESSDDSELDSDPSLDVETITETSFPNQEENFSKPIDNRGFILGLIIGIFIALCLGLVFPNQHTYLTTLYK